MKRLHGLNEKSLTAACAALLTSAKGKQEAFVCLGKFLLVQSSAQAPARRGLISGLRSRSVPDLWHQDFCLPAQSAVDWTLLHAASRLWNASDSASDTIKITNYRAQWE